MLGIRGKGRDHDDVVPSVGFNVVLPTSALLCTKCTKTTGVAAPGLSPRCKCSVPFARSLFRLTIVGLSFFFCCTGVGNDLG